ncbi:unnamed protein product [Didymodactylos carnosus]|uniref:Uncharacterized protein n=1 Tax=Didymodactylos carnosus TaxID=1234261 RepID=A0A8S2Z814_9BILA|nr:unnamed protein product [Didymodactylos carnosus]
MCYSDKYAAESASGSKFPLTDSLNRQCNKQKLLLACRSVGATTFTLAAMGMRSNVLFDCKSDTRCTHIANDVGWYYSPTHSCGFVNGTDSVYRDKCDKLTDKNSNLRLCWQPAVDEGGYRCEINKPLNADLTWKRTIWHAN